LELWLGGLLAQNRIKVGLTVTKHESLYHTGDVSLSLPALLRDGKFQAGPETAVIIDGRYFIGFPNSNEMFNMPQ